MVEKVTKLALSSRLILLCIQLVADSCIPDHKPDVFKSPIDFSQKIYPLDRLIYFLFGGLRRWDTEYFLHIAEYGYTYENTLAFYPLYPISINIASNMFMSMTFNCCNFQYVALLIGILLNLFFFCQATNCLYELTQKIFSDPNKSWNAVILFCFNPASVFFTAPYSEALYCWLTFWLMLECISSIRIFRTILILSLNLLSRSNGIINLGYPCYFLLRKFILKKNVFDIFKLFLIVIGSIISLSIYSFYIFQQYCSLNSTIEHSYVIRQYAKEKNYLLSGERNLSSSQSPWCDYSIPFPYTYVQNYYWDVGLFKYYNFIQIPNFLLALPILSFLLYTSFQYIINLGKQLKRLNFLEILYKYKSIPFVVHCIFLIGFCICFVHIQVSTRLIASSNPCLYWFAADSLPKLLTDIKGKSKNALLLYWFGGYYLIGTILFCNFLPWT